MNTNNLTRRQFLATASVGTVAAVTSAKLPAFGNISKKAGELAILGGKPVRTKPFSCTWPIWDKSDEKLLLSVMRSRSWSRGKVVEKAEKIFTELMGAKYCLATSCGTYALVASLHALGIGAGDEVLTTPYTFVATIDAILLVNALPVFVDTDPETVMMNPDKIEEKITEHTTAILPVHIEGGVCDMDRINAVAKKHNLKVVEDACQAHLAEWRGKKVGTLGDLGCFSFQETKDIPAGEGGAILGSDKQIMDICFSYHNFGRPHGSVTGDGYPILGTKCRMTEYQAAILIPQMARAEKQNVRMAENAEYLTSRLKEIPGIIPRKNYEGTTRTAFYTYSFRYKKEHFDGLPREKFLNALEAEGVHFAAGLGPDNCHNLAVKGGFIEKTLSSKTFQKIYSKERLDKYREQNDCPDNDQLCKEVVCCGGKKIFLYTDKRDMDDIADAILKVYENRGKLL